MVGWDSLICTCITWRTLSFCMTSAFCWGFSRLRACVSRAWLEGSKDIDCAGRAYSCTEGEIHVQISHRYSICLLVVINCPLVIINCHLVVINRHLVVINCPLVVIYCLLVVINRLLVVINHTLVVINRIIARAP